MGKTNGSAPHRSARISRKAVNEVSVLNVKNIATGEVYFARAQVVDVSPTGVLLRIKRDDIIAIPLRSTLSLNAIVEASVGFTIEVMDTYIEGIVARTKSEGKGAFVVAVDFREDAPKYWRECLVDLLPGHDDKRD